MRLLLPFVVCALALLQACIGVPTPALRGGSRVMPSKEERDAGARPSGGRRGWAATAALPTPEYEGPMESQPDFAGVVSVNNDDTQVYVHNGNNAKLGQFPWMLAINMDGNYFCGGSIISSNWVLTAGHCVFGYRLFVLTAGTTHSGIGYEDTKQILLSTKGYRHPGYNDQTLDNDIAVIKASEDFFLDGTYVTPIRLPSHLMAKNSMAGTTATISGWGITSDTDEYISPDLKYVDLVINDGNVCNEYYGNEVWKPSKICVDTSKNENSSCEGDSGGPLVIQEADGKWTEVGLTSFGAAKGCSVGLPVAFTRVASFLDFIESTTHIKARAH